MAGTKTPRTTLESNFAAGQIPRQEHFYNLLWSSFNQYDDGIQKSQTDPLKIQAAKNSPQEEVLQFYTDFSSSPNWTIGQNPNQDTTKRGLNIEDGSGNSRLFISEADGNVGIGTPSPQSKLDVNGAFSADLTSTHTLLTLSADGQSDDNKSNIGVGFGSSIAFAAQRGGDRPGVGTGGFIDYYLHEMDNDVTDRWAFRFRLRDNQWPSNNPNDPGSTVMTLLANGNVGIGTPSPQSKLDVQGGISIGASYAGTSVAPTNGVIIEGNVGIGTPTPYHNLEVDTNVTSETPVLDQENSYESMKVVIGNQWQSFTVGAGGSATGTVYLVKIEVAIEKCSGILSIYEGRGTSGKKLHSQPYDSSQMEWLTINLNRIIPVTIGQEYTIYASNVRWLSGSLNDGAPVYPYGVSSNQSYSMAFRTYTVTSVNLDPTLTVSRGNVGIGTGTPGFPLSFADALGDKISLWGQSGAHSGFGIQPNILQIYSGANTTDIAFGYGSSADFTETARIKGNGNVGIGTPSPQSKLDVNGAFAADLTSTHTLLTLSADGQSDDNKSNIGVGFGSSIAFAAQRGGDRPGVGTGGFIDYYLHEMDNDVTDRWAFRFRLRDNQWPSNNPNDPGSTVMTLLANGNVGIGTPSPQSKLDVQGGISIGASYAGTSVAPTNGVIIEGNVGIGTSTPYHNLEVVTTVGNGTPQLDQDVSPQTGTWWGAATNWQSFTVGATGDPLYLVKVEVQTAGDMTGEFRIYEGRGTSGNLLHRQNYLTNENGWNPLVLTDPIQVRTGQEYTIWFSRITWYMTQTPYSGGVRGGSGGPPAGSISNFKTYVVNSISDKTTLAVSSGRVGIGTTEPGTDALDVRGTAYVSGGVQTSNADYAELLESNRKTRIPIGTSVVMSKSGLIRPAKKGESPIGVVSSRPAIVGNSYKEWPRKYLYDEFGQPMLETVKIPFLDKKVPLDIEDAEIISETKSVENPSKEVDLNGVSTITKVRKKLNPDYDPSQPYVRREDRPEWNYVGLLGQLVLLKGQPVADTWHKIKDLSDKTELWLVK